jgi:hypothetical protein
MDSAIVLTDSHYSNRRRAGTWALRGDHPDMGLERSNGLKRPVIPFLLERVGESSMMITLKALWVLKRLEE